MRISKRLCFLFLSLLFLILPLTSCGTQLKTEPQENSVSTEEKGETLTMEETTSKQPIPQAPIATQTDISQLEALYAGRHALYGDIHCHPKAGVAPDGKQSLAAWKEQLAQLGIDFVAFLNHRQLAHMYEADWDSTLFIGGTEPATRISDCSNPNPTIHYNMLLPGPEALLELVTAFPEYKYTGGQNGILLNEGTFTYPSFTRDRLREVIAKVKSLGGLFVLAHPKDQDVMASNKPLDYYLSDYTGLEVFYGYRGSIVGQDTKDNYKLWTDLLAMGKRLWATAGSDSHNDATTAALTCIYSEKNQDTAYLSHLKEGDFTPGFAGIRMAIGDTKMGSSTNFQGKRLVVSVGDFYKAVDGRTYTVNIITDAGVIYTGTTDGKETAYFALDADENAAFYRVEVLDERRTAQPIIAIGNPIWND